MAVAFISIALLGSVNVTQIQAQTQQPALSYPKNGEIAYANYNSTFMPWTRKEAIVPLWIDFANQHGGTYESIGKSSSPEKWDIVAFKFGNPAKPAIMINAQVHGNEHYGYEVLYALANWLVSDDPTAKSILENNYVILIPVVDYRWARTNYNYQSVPDPYIDVDDNKSSGVDLNRNFAPSWSSALIEQQYSGVAPDSEPEAQALITAWNKYQPRIYWTLDQGSTRVYSEAVATTTQQNADLAQLKTILPEIAQSIGASGSLLNISVKKTFGSCYGGYGKGYVIDGASSHGAAGIISELKMGWGYTDEIRADLNSGETFKQAKAIFIAMAQAVESQSSSASSPIDPFSPSQPQTSSSTGDSSSSPSDSVNPEGTPASSKQATVFVTGDIALIILVIIGVVAGIALVVNLKKRSLN